MCTVYKIDRIVFDIDLSHGAQKRPLNNIPIKNKINSESL